jgi:hypothetical protein
MENNQAKTNKREASLKIKDSLLESTTPVKKFVAPIIISLFIILGFILGGLYYWYSVSTKPVVIDLNPTRPTLETNKEPETRTATAQVDSLTVMSTSDELSAIEADLLSTDLDSLETEINQIEAELEAN